MAQTEKINKYLLSTAYKLAGINRFSLRKLFVRFTIMAYALLVQDVNCLCIKALKNFLLDMQHFFCNLNEDKLFCYIMIRFALS